MYALEQLALQMAETPQKRRRLEFASSGVSILFSAKKSTKKDEEDKTQER
jgi:hypothetical protein